MTLAKGLAGRGYAVDVWCYGGASQLDDDLRRAGVQVRCAEPGSRRSKLGSIRRWMAGTRPDVVHGFMKRASSLAVLSRGIHRRPIVIGSDMSTATYGRRDLTLLSSLVLFGFTDAVVTQTELNRRSLHRLAPWLRGKVRVVRNGLDLSGFRPRTFDPLPQPFRFASVGSVYSVKNPLRAVEAVAALVAEGRRDFVLDWFGRRGLSGDDSPSEAYEATAAFVAKHQLQQFVRFHGERPDIAAHLRECHAILHPSVQEGFPNAVVEGMACGLPVVVSRVSDLPLVVEEARNGYVFDETRATSIAEGMAAMLDTSAVEREAMGRRSRELAERWFGIDRFVEEYEELYDNLLSARGSGAIEHDASARGAALEGE